MADKIDLNTADRKTLATLPGIGEALAERIIAFREEVHPFEEVIEMAAVSGISERMVRDVEDRITVSVAPTAGQEMEAEPTAGEDGARTVEEEPVAPSVEREDEEGSEGKAPVSETPETDIGVDDAVPRAVATDEAAEVAGRAPAARETTPASGRGLGCTVLGIVAGAVVGVSLTLFFLFLLNGTLLFGDRQRVAGLEQEVLMQERDQEALETVVADTSAELATAVAAQETAVAAQTDTVGELEELAGDLDDLETDVMPAVATLEAQTAAQATRLSGVAAAAASFDAFLTSMRDLLIDLQGLPPTPTSTPSPSPTPSATGGTATPEDASPASDETQTATPAGPTLTPTPTPATTRTPRPTSTPIVRPTATPTD